MSRLGNASVRRRRSSGPLFESVTAIERLESRILLTPGSPTDIPADAVGTFNDGWWNLDLDYDNDLFADPADTIFHFGLPGDQAIVGDWNGDGFDDIGVFRDGWWYLDSNGTRHFDGADAVFQFGQAGDVPVAGDFNGDGIEEIGVFRDGRWYLDADGSMSSGTAGDLFFTFGMAGDTPVVIDPDASGPSNMAVFRKGVWSVDSDGDGFWDGDGEDDAFTFTSGHPDEVPLVGNWLGPDGIVLSNDDNFAVARWGELLIDEDEDNARGPGDATIDHFFETGVLAGRWSRVLEGGRVGPLTVIDRDEAAVFAGGWWTLDIDGNGTTTLADADAKFVFGLAGDAPVAGDFDGDGFDEIGVFRDGVWYLDGNGNRRFDTAGAIFAFGLADDQPVVGDWDGDGRDDVAVYRPGTRTWYLDLDHDFAFGVADAFGAYGPDTSDGVAAVSGDWFGDGKDEVGVFYNGTWFVDYDGDLAVDPFEVFSYSFEGADPQQAAPGDWNADLITDPGVVRGARWHLDREGDRHFNRDNVESHELTDLVFSYGHTADIVLAGRWRTEFGIPGQT